jgi:hypothetical protein
MKHIRESDFHFLRWRSDPFSGGHDGAKFQRRPRNFSAANGPPRGDKSIRSHSPRERLEKFRNSAPGRMRKGEKLQPANKK